MDFVHLHVHTHYSILDGAGRVPDLVGRAAAFGMNSLAITDHGNLFGVLDFYKGAKNAGIKPVIGCEFYIAPGSRTDRSAASAREASSHLVLLAKDQEGFNNLSRLSTLSYTEGFYHKPRIDRELLNRYSRGIIVLTACLSGEVARKLLNGREDDAVRIAAEYADIVGKENVFVELHRCGLKDQERILPGLLRVAKRTGLPVVATNDVHYPAREDALVQDVLYCIEGNTRLDDDKRRRLGSDEFYLRSPEEMTQLFADIPEAVGNSVEIAERCDVRLTSDTTHAPVFRPEDGSTPEELLRKLCEKGLRERYGEPTEEQWERLEHELRIIEEKRFSSYFLIVWDFVRFAGEHGIRCGARGSGVGAMVTYVLGVSDVDPLKYGLLFERFLDPSRNEMPDLDIDMCQARRGEVIDYVRKKYGSENVAQLITFGKFKTRGAIRDVGRVLGWKYSDVDKLLQKIESGAVAIPDRKSAKLSPPPEVAPTPRDSQEAREQRLLSIAARIDGLNRHSGIHAAGVIIADRPLHELVPMYAVKDRDTKLRTESVCQWDMYSVESTGLLKMDMLGLMNLTLIDHALELVRRTTGDELDIDSVPLDDQETMALFANGETSGIFQFESSGMRDTLSRIEPDNVNNLIAANALYRPGPMRNIPEYADRKHGRKKWSLPHPIMEEVLEETYGIIVYQEQVMLIANRIGGISLERSYRLIKAISKKNDEVISAEHDSFVEGAIQKGISTAQADEIFALIEKFAEYGFNKSHSTSYALLAYKTAYLKAHYPKEYMAALLSVNRDRADHMSMYASEVEHMKIPLLPPDINESGVDFTVSDNGIRYGLGAIKGVGTRAADAVLSERERGGRFESAFDFVERVDLRAANRSALDALARSGAFDCFGLTRASLEASLDALVSHGARVQQRSASGQASLFASSSGGHVRPQIKNLPEKPMEEILADEANLLHKYFSGHPLDVHQNMVRAFSQCPPEKIASFREGARLVVGGIPTDISRGKTTRGTPRLVFRLQGKNGACKVTLMGDTCKACGDIVASGKVVFVHGRLDNFGGVASLTGDDVIPVGEAIERLTGHLVVSVDGKTASKSTVSRLASILRARPGRVPVDVNVRVDGRVVRLRAGQEFRVAPSAELLDELAGLLGRDAVNVARSNVVWASRRDRTPAPVSDSPTSTAADIPPGTSTGEKPPQLDLPFGAS